MTTHRDVEAATPAAPLVPTTPRGWCSTEQTPIEEDSLRARYWFGLQPRTFTVVATAQLSETLVRVRFSADDDFEGFATVGAEDHVKLFFDTDDAGAPVVPGLVDGRVEARGLTYRDYTIRWFDPASRLLDIDFVIHDHGVAGRWAASAAPGDRLASLGPRGSHRVKDVFPWYVFATDETALPALGRWLEGLRPAVPVTAYVEVAGPDSQIELPTSADLTLVWLHRGDAPESASLSDAIAAHDFPGREGFVWVAGEAVGIKPARRFLKDAGFDRAHWDVDGYWRRGTVNLDHHAPDDED